MLSVGGFAFARDATWRVVPYLWLLSVTCAWTVRSQGEPHHRSWADAVLTACVLGLLAAVALVVIVLVGISKNGFPP